MTTATSSGSARGKRMLSALPELAAQWHPTMNGDLTPDSVTFKSAKNVWWLGECGHEWDMKVFNRTAGRGCPICAGRRVLAGFNDLASLYPDVAAEWDNEKNGDLTPQQVTGSSHTKAWWRCDLGHSWYAEIGSRTKNNGKGNGCPYCGNRKVLAGFNDLATIDPELSKWWHPTKNEPTSTSDVLASSTHKYWWQCADNTKHAWKASPFERRRGSGCPYCKNRVVLTGETDLESLYPGLAKEWHPKKNSGVSPNNTLATSKKEVWWLCSRNPKHEWFISPASRVRGNTSCPFCAGKRVIAGDNDLATLLPEIAAEWHPSMNGSLTPDAVPVSSTARVWWLCPKGKPGSTPHEWKAFVYDRTRKGRGSGCPQCNFESIVSKAEQQVADYVELLGFDVETSNRKVLKGKELDIYIPSEKIAIEFNGLFWHTEAMGKDRDYHYNKWKDCRDQGIQLIQVWEDQWRDKRGIVESMLAHKLGASNVRRIAARKTEVIKVSTDVAQRFLEEHHIQGFVSGSHYLALRPRGTEDDIVALMVLRKQGADMLLARYATSVHVLGGQSKLVKHAERSLKYENLVTFADLEVSDGSLYETTGFVQDSFIEPDYRYLYDGERRHKFGFRLKRFREDPDLLFEEGLSERELAELNGIERIWDTGKIRYVKPRPQNRLSS